MIIKLNGVEIHNDGTKITLAYQVKETDNKLIFRFGKMIFIQDNLDRVFVNKLLFYIKDLSEETLIITFNQLDAHNQSFYNFSKCYDMIEAFYLGTDLIDAIKKYLYSSCKNEELYELLLENVSGLYKFEKLLAKSRYGYYFIK